MDLVGRSLHAVRFYCRYVTFLRLTHPHLTKSAELIARFIIVPFETKLKKVLEEERIQLQIATLSDPVEAVKELPQPTPDEIAYFSGIFVWLIESIDHHLLGLQCSSDISKRSIENIDVFRYVGAWMSAIEWIPSQPLQVGSVAQTNINMLRMITERFEDNSTEFGFGAENPVWDKVRAALTAA